MNIEITEEERKYLVDTAVEKVLHGRSEGRAWLARKAAGR